MEVDAVQLSNQERERRRKKGLCFKCGAPGHMSNNCNNSFLKKEGKKTENKKPEVSAKIEEIPDSDEELTVGAVSAQDF